MHYYKKNLGDYAKKAGRLSMLQHGAYNLLIDASYDRERFPTLEEAYDWAWASTEAEREAVAFVLQRFFILQVDGTYIQKRIKEEVEHYQARSVTNKRIAQEREAKRWESGTKRERNVNESPPNHKPLTNNQEPLTNITPPIVPPEGDIGETGPRDVAKYALELITLLSNRSFKPIESNLKPIMARMDDGHSALDIGMVLRHQWLQWKGTESEKYFRPSTLFCPSKFEGYLNDAKNPQKTRINRSSRDMSLEECLTDTSWAD